jgi:alkanesulfonate monooxygenase SsuD/methylene tetrahydromethanopterin reductase-like flavin-dependent oxidoreductase (luciferase family)
VLVNAQIDITSDLTLERAIESAIALERAGVAALTLRCGDTAPGAPAFEPNTLAAALAYRTDRVGLIVDDSALYGFPYHLARRLATLDHLTGGRAGWAPRLASTPAEIGAYAWRPDDDRGSELARAGEYAEIVLELWDSWEPGAERPDKSTGDFKDDSRIHRIDYQSPSFFVRGPLDTPRSPQHRPMIAVDVAGETELAFAADFADIAVLRATGPGNFWELAAALEVARAGDARPILRFAVVESTDDTEVDETIALAEGAGLDGVTVRLDGTAAATGRAIALVDAVRVRGLLVAPASGATLARTLGIDDGLAVGKRVAA